MISRWEKGEDISLARDVFKKISAPNFDRMKKLWKALCQFTHATIYSQQTISESEKAIEHLNMNFALLRALLEMNYHLFNRHLVNSSMKFYFDSYATEEEKARYKQLKINVGKLFSTSKKVMSNETKGIIRDFKASWVVTS